jgi:hypothetical protein
MGGCVRPTPPLLSGIDGVHPLDAGCGDAKRGGSREDSRDPKPISRPREMYDTDMHIDTLKVTARNFR